MRTESHMNGTVKVNNYKVILLFSFILGGFLIFPQLLSQSKYHKEIPYSNEDIVDVRLEAAFGTVNIAGGILDKILIADMIIEPSMDMKTDINYRLDNKRGLLGLILQPSDSQKRTWGIGGSNAGTWDLQFKKDVPLRFDIEMGAGRGNFDFSGLHIDQLNLSTGASRVNIVFDEPNQGFIEEIKIESGVSRFTGENLGNANFGKLNFEGGVGAYTLNFDGDLQHEAEVNVELGIGAITLIVPDHIGAKLYAEQRLFSSVNVPNDFKRLNRDEYVSANYETAQGRLIIRVESGLGSVRVQR